MKLHHVGLFTNRPRSILHFYQRKLGLRKEYRTVLSRDIMNKIFGINIDCYMDKLTLDDLCIEVFHPKNMRKGKKIRKIVGINHFCLGVADKKKFCDKLEKKFRVRIIRIKKDNNYYVYFIKDPDGNLIEIKNLNWIL